MEALEKLSKEELERLEEFLLWAVGEVRVELKTRTVHEVSCD